MANPTPPYYITTSPNMGLQVPTTGSTPGPQWFEAVVQSLNIIDAHNHSPGEGVVINQSGLFFTGPLSLTNQSITAVQSITFNPTTTTAIDTLYVSGVDLYYNDGNGNPPIQITSGGSVNATSSGIVSGTATASFVGSVLVVNAAATTPANIQVGSVLLGNNSAGSFYYELSPPGAMGAPVGPIILPNPPTGSTKLLSMTTTGIITASTAVDGTSITGLGGTLSVGPQTGVASVNNSATIASNGTTLATIAASSLTFTATGRPVYLQASFTLGATITAESSADAILSVSRGSTKVDAKLLQVAGGSTHSTAAITVCFVDPAPGTGSVTYNFAATGTVNCTLATLTTTAYSF